MGRRRRTEGVAGDLFRATSVTGSTAHKLLDEMDKNKGGSFRAGAGDALLVQAQACACGVVLVKMHQSEKVR